MTPCHLARWPAAARVSPTCRLSAADATNAAILFKLSAITLFSFGITNNGQYIFRYSNSLSVNKQIEKTNKFLVLLISDYESCVSCFPASRRVVCDKWWWIVVDWRNMTCCGAITRE